MGSLCRPGSTFAVAVMERGFRPGPSLGLLQLNMLVAAALVSLGLLPYWSHRWEAMFPIAVAIYGVLGLLTWIESLGLRFIGRRRGWRITPDVAGVICDHASAGWVVGGLLMMLVLLLDPGGRLAAAGWAQEIARGIIHKPLSEQADLLRAFAFGGACVTGILIFESLVYVGMHRCRFANPPPAARAPDA